MRIPLSLTKDYCSDWGVIEGIRELLQNWLDAEGTSLTYNAEGKRLRLTNKGVRIGPADIGLLGRSRKGPGARGHFGEGLKIGVLALIRLGLTVHIESDDRRYTACLEKAEELGGEEILVFHSEKGGGVNNAVRVTVWGLEETTWRECRRNTLAIREKPYLAHTTEGGEILLDPEEKGRVYCKGLFVSGYDGLDHGYNFTSEAITVDRDRKMIRDFDLNWELSRMHASRFREEKIGADEFLEDLEKGSRATRYAANFLDPSHKKAVAEAFDEKHGKRAVPGAAPRHLKGIPCPDSLENVLCEHKVARLLNTGEAVRVMTPWETLTPAEKECLSTVEFAFEECGLSPCLFFCEFEDPEVRFTRDKGKIRIARRCLASRTELLEVIVAGIEGRDSEIYLKLIAQARGWND